MSSGLAIGWFFGGLVGAACTTLGSPWWLTALSLLATAAVLAVVDYRSATRRRRY